MGRPEEAPGRDAPSAPPGSEAFRLASHAPRMRSVERHDRRHGRRGKGHTMRDLTELTLTEAVERQMADTPDPRLREIMAAAVRHLHAFAREVSLTPEEWLFGIRFLTEVGQACTPFRQEFILLSDTLGLSRMVNILHDARGAAAGHDELGAATVHDGQGVAMGHDGGGPVAGTETSLLGPFYRERSPLLPSGASIARVPEGEEICVFGRVLDEAGAPVADASLEVWQTDPDGAYDLQAHEPGTMDWRARFHTDELGRFWFRATLPHGYTIPMDGPVGRMIRAQERHGCRPAHTHFLIGAPGFRELVTALYFGSDPYIDSDTVFGVSRSLVVEPRAGVAGAPAPELRAIQYDFTLARARAGEDAGRVGADPASLLAR